MYYYYITLAYDTTQGQRETGSDSNQGVLQGSSITGASPSDCLVSYTYRDAVYIFYSPAGKFNLFICNMWFVSE